MPGLDGTGPKGSGCENKKSNCCKNNGNSSPNGNDCKKNVNNDRCKNRPFASKEEEINFLELQISLMQNRITELKN